MKDDRISVAFTVNCVTWQQHQDQEGGQRFWKVHTKMVLEKESFILHTCLV